ncbi:ABC transporter B family member 9-like [Magnolia sinica]|uniref:ABC transporter B family member 9-like n=1 Tax=Magnolia sinica TaxID=86752 RepID=UPI002658EFD2|nr:ABC transporter B family member 9-like [Magnolia sinica]
MEKWEAELRICVEKLRQNVEERDEMIRFMSRKADEEEDVKEAKIHGHGSKSRATFGRNVEEGGDLGEYCTDFSRMGRIRVSQGLDPENAAEMEAAATATSPDATGVATEAAAYHPGVLAAAMSQLPTQYYMAMVRHPGRATTYKMFETIKWKPEINAYDTSGIVLEDINSDIEPRDVCFSYPARPDIHVFSGFSSHVPSGTTVALVGESGSGKSTAISLLERFYEPQAGEVLIDDTNLKKLQLGWIREKIGLVSKSPSYSQLL